jgi:DNA-directed RNA polymerase subunit beta'
VKAGDKLSEGAICPVNLLEIKGKSYMQKYLVNELQEVYRLQGVKINDKHMEIIILQMISKVEIVDSGDTGFIVGSLIDKKIFRNKNDDIFFKKIVTNKGESTKYNVGDLMSIREIAIENSLLKKAGKKELELRSTRCAIAKTTLCGITITSLSNQSVLAAASFQEPTKILSEAAIRGAVDNFKDLKSRIISGQLVLIGTGANTLQNDEKVVSSLDSKTE